MKNLNNLIGSNSENQSKGNNNKNNNKIKYSVDALQQMLADNRYLNGVNHVNQGMPTQINFEGNNIDISTMQIGDQKTTTQYQQALDIADGQERNNSLSQLDKQLSYKIIFNLVEYLKINFNGENIEQYIMQILNLKSQILANYPNNELKLIIKDDSIILNKIKKNKYHLEKDIYISNDNLDINLLKKLILEKNLNLIYPYKANNKKEKQLILSQIVENSFGEFKPINYEANNEYHNQKNTKELGTFYLDLEDYNNRLVLSKIIELKDNYLCREEIHALFKPIKSHHLANFKRNNFIYKQVKIINEDVDSVKKFSAYRYKYHNYDNQDNIPQYSEFAIVNSNLTNFKSRNPNHFLIIEIKKN